VKKGMSPSPISLLRQLKSLDFEKRFIILIILIFLIRGTIYATVFPLWQAPDEPHHFFNVAIRGQQYLPNTIGQTSRMDIAKLTNANNTKVIRFSIYYWLSLVVYLAFVFGNFLTRVYALRFLSIILGGMVVLLTYKTAKEITPENKFIVLAAPLFVSFQPMFTYITSTINSDNLANLTSAVFLWLAAKCIKQNISMPKVAALLLALTASILAKRSTLFLIPIAAVILPIFVIFRAESKNRAELTRRILLASAIVVGFFLSFPILQLLAGALTTYPLHLDKLYSLVKQFFQNPQYHSILEKHFTIFFMTFWANFGWADLPIAPFYYDILRNICWLFVISLIFFFMHEKIVSKSKYSRAQLLFFVFLILSVGVAISFMFTYNAVVAKGSASPQGRYIFTAIGALALLFALGISQFFKQKYYIYLLSLFTAALFIFDSICLFQYIIPRYYRIFTLTLIRLKFMPGLVTQPPSLLNGTHLLFPAIFIIYLVLLGNLGYLMLKNGKKIEEKPAAGNEGL